MASATLPAVILVTLCCVTLTLALDALWFGSLPDVVETTPLAQQIKTSRVGQGVVKQRIRPTSTVLSNVTSSRQRVTSLKRRVNASPPLTSTPPANRQLKNVTVNPAFEAKQEEVTYWETGSGSAVGSESGSSSSNDSVSVSVKEHDRSPHPGAFSGGGAGGGWFGRFKSSAADAGGPSEPVSVAGYQSKEQSAIKGSEAEATVQIKEHDEPGGAGGGGAHFSFSAAGGADESALWFGGGDDTGHSSKTENPSSSSSSSDDGGGGGGAWFGLDDWAPLSLDSNTGHRQQRTLIYRQAEEDKVDDIITAPPQSSRDIFSFVVNSNLGGGEESRSESAVGPPSDTAEDVLITAEPSVAEDEWFEEESTTTSTAKPQNRNSSYIVGVSQMATVNEQQHSVEEYDDEKQDTDSNNILTTTTSTSVAVNKSEADIADDQPLPINATSINELELLFSSEDNVTTETPPPKTTAETNSMDTNPMDTNPMDTIVEDRLPTSINREGRDFETDNSFAGMNSNINDESRSGFNLTKAPIMTAAIPPKVIKNGPLASNSMVNRESRDNTAYIIVGSCCAVSLACLIIVVAILRYRKSIRRRHRHNPFHHYPMDRDPRFCHFEPNSTWSKRAHPPTTVQGHKTAHHFAPPPPPTALMPNQKTRNLWFIGQKRSSPYALCEQQQQQHLGYSAEQQDGGGMTSSSTTHGRSSGHSSGLESMSKGELIYWSSNSEQLI